MVLRQRRHAKCVSEVGSDMTEKEGIKLIEHKYRHAVRVPMGKRSLSVILDRMDFGHILGVGMEARFFGTEPEFAEVSHPATWRDAVLERWAPGWLKRWVKPTIVTVRLERFCVYPEIEKPGGGKYIDVPIARIVDIGDGI